MRIFQHFFYLYFLQKKKKKRDEEDWKFEDNYFQMTQSLCPKSESNVHFIAFCWSNFSFYCGVVSAYDVSRAAMISWTRCLCVCVRLFLLEKSLNDLSHLLFCFLHLILRSFLCYCFYGQITLVIFSVISLCFIGSISRVWIFLNEQRNRHNKSQLIAFGCFIFIWMQRHFWFLPGIVSANVKQRDHFGQREKLW